MEMVHHCFYRHFKARLIAYEDQTDVIFWKERAAYGAFGEVDAKDDLFSCNAQVSAHCFLEEWMTKKVFSRILKEKMDSMSLTQEVLAERMGVSPATISRWIQGKAFPQPEKRSLIAKTLGMTLEELGLAGKEIEQLDIIIEHITQIILSEEINLPQKLRNVANYLEKLPAWRREPSSGVDSSFYSRVQPSSTKHEEAIARTVEGKEHHLSWLGPQDSYIENVVAIETGNHIASWRYLQKNGQPYREPSDIDMHLHVRNGYTVSYDPPILLMRLYMVSPSTGAKCVPS